MAGNGELPLTDAPQDITGEDFTALAFQAQGAPIKVAATSGTTAPDPVEGVRYEVGEGEPTDRDLSTIFPGVGTIQRVWAWRAESEFKASIFRSWSS